MSFGDWRGWELHGGCESREEGKQCRWEVYAASSRGSEKVLRRRWFGGRSGEEEHLRQREGPVQRPRGSCMSGGFDRKSERLEWLGQGQPVGMSHKREKQRARSDDIRSPYKPLKMLRWGRSEHLE